MCYVLLHSFHISTNFKVFPSNGIKKMHILALEPELQAVRFWYVILGRSLKPFVLVSHHNKMWKKSRGWILSEDTVNYVCGGSCVRGVLCRLSYRSAVTMLIMSVVRLDLDMNVLLMCFCISTYCMLRFSSFSSLIHFLSLHSNPLYRLSLLSPSVVFIGPLWPFSVSVLCCLLFSEWSCSSVALPLVSLLLEHSCHQSNSGEHWPNECQDSKKSREASLVFLTHMHTHTHTHHRRLLNGGWLIIMPGMEWMEWHQTLGNQCV